MRSNQIRVFVIGVAAVTIGIYAERAFSTENKSANDPVTIAVDKGVKWLVSVQGKDGGWGQDGGETSYVRQGERLESSGNDIANTAVVAEALLHAGGPLRREVNIASRCSARYPSSSIASSKAPPMALQ